MLKERSVAKNVFVVDQNQIVHLSQSAKVVLTVDDFIT